MDIVRNNIGNNSSVNLKSKSIEARIKVVKN